MDKTYIVSPETMRVSISETTECNSNWKKKTEPWNIGSKQRRIFFFLKSVETFYLNFVTSPLGVL